MDGIYLWKYKLSQVSHDIIFKYICDMDVDVLVIGYTQEIFAEVKLALMLMKVAKMVENIIYINLK